MAGEGFGGQIQPVKPVSEEVGRPTNAPNYAGMFSEAIRGALAPYQYILDWKKAMSEDDFRKAEAQNFLDEHDLKVQQLGETRRENVAKEAQAKLAFGLDSAKQQETSRHNQAEEQSQALRDRIDQQAKDEDARWHDMESQRFDAQQAETKRHNEADEKKAQDELEQKKITDQALIARENAEREHQQTLDSEAKLKLQDRADDERTIRDATEWVHKQRPQDLYASQDNPEIQQMITDTWSKLKTDDGRHRWEGIMGPATALGMEVDERSKLSAMSPDAKKAFMETYINTDPNDHQQNRFGEAMFNARQAEERFKVKKLWGTDAWDAYNKSIATHQPGMSAKDIEQGAYSAGNTAQEHFMARLKQEEKAPKTSGYKPSREVMDKVQAAMPKGKDESADAYDARTSAEALRIDYLKDTNPTEYQKALDNLGGRGGGQPGSTSSKARAEFWTGQHSMATPAVGATNLAAATTTPAPVPAAEAAGGGGSFLLPGMTNRYAAAIDSGSLTDSMNALFQGGGQGTEEEGEEALA